MILYPAIDLKDGQAVRLLRGEMEKATVFNDDPAAQARAFVEAGCEWLHLVDLTGAKDTSARQLDLIAKLLASTPANIQIGGGVRTEQDVIDLLEAGAQRVVVGSTAVKQPALVKGWMEKYGAEKIVLALDINIDQDGTRKVAISGWQEDSGVTIEALLDEYLTVGLKHVLCTDISRDGTLAGSNVELYVDLCQQYPQVQFQSSGGIGSLADIEALKGSGVAGVIVGRALLDGKFTAEEAFACWQNA